MTSEGRRGLRCNLRTVATLLVVGMGALLVVASGIASMAAQRVPDIALKFAPWDAQANGRKSELVFAHSLEARQFGEAAALARRAIARDPTNVPAIRTLGLIEQLSGQSERGDTLLTLAGELTRRDLATEVQAIEAAVAKEDVRGALRHYDNALRTSRRAGPLLLPVLAQATGDANLIRPIADTLVKNPQWLFPFYREAMQSGPSVANLTELSAIMQARGQPLVRDVRIALISRQIAAREWDLVRQEFGRGRRASAFGRGVNDGGFDHVGDLIPVDWVVAQDGTAEIEISQDAAGNGRRLSFLLSSRRNAELARQLTLLEPGRYVISFTTGGWKEAGQAATYSRIECAEGSGQRLVDMERWRSRGNARIAGFTVPASGCGGQWLMIRAASGSDEAAGWIDDVEIHRAG